MKTLIIIFILFFSSSVVAEDISDFQIEGISVGDSLLDYFTETQILKNKRNYLEGKRKFYVVGTGNLNLKTYDSVDIYLKRNDKHYLVHQVVAFIFFKKNFDKGKIKQKEIIDNFNLLLKNWEIVEQDTTHPYDSSGLSKVSRVIYSLNSEYIAVECLNWSNAIKKKNPGWTDNLNVKIVNEEVNDWMDSGYP